LTQSDARLRVYHNTVNVGPYVSKNRALRLAKGAYITGHDADDIALPDRIARQMAPILADPKCRASIGYMMGVDGTGSFVRPSKPNLADKYTLDGVLRLASIALLIERSFLYQHLGYWDCVKVSADTELLERLMAVQPNVLTLVKSCTMICLVHEQSLTQNVHSGLSNFEGHSQTRKEYKVAFRAWHSASRPDQRRLDFPPQPRAFKAPEKMVVPIDDILTVIDQDRPPIQA
jgi:glycosyltransferase involved in cell wall biosynthesis